MISMRNLYPPTPVNVPATVTEVSPAFKKEVSGVMGAIVFFFVVYLLLFILSIGLVIGCFYAGVAIIINVPRVITVFAGLGLVGVGVMVFVFLVKFLFAVSKYDRSGIVEVTEAEQPELFSFIRHLTKDTQTQFPKRIYLSPDVNACVFYDSSFWSMFFPVKKNLQIGLGLVNSLNISEFKAVMAHEFGHFSQRSMKLGSFVYHVNKIIYNMLFDNQSYSKFLESWAKLDGVFAIFAGITAGIARGIQGILRGLYGIINKKYMSLSREMEFHADAVAASVSGSKPLGSALRRIEMASAGYDIAIQKCDEFFRQNKVSKNIYPHQVSVLQQLAREYKLPLENEVPVVSEEFTRSNKLSRVNFKDQWASHPSTEDRTAHLEQLAVEAVLFNEPAWKIFSNKEQLQQILTDKVYANATVPADAAKLDENEFDNKLAADISENILPEAYNGFYDNRQITLPGADFSFKKPIPGDTPFDEIFNTGNALLSKKINATVQDIELVKAIQEKRIDTRVFEFDGKKYNQKETAVVLAMLETDLNAMKEKLESLDVAAIQFFYEKAKRKSESDAAVLEESYVAYFALRKQADEYMKCIDNMMLPLQQMFSQQGLTIETVRSVICVLKDVHEPAFKKQLQTWADEGALQKDLVLLEKVNTYLQANYAYFHETGFFETEISALNDIVNQSWGAITGFVFENIKSILEKQLSLLN